MVDTKQPTSSNAGASSHLLKKDVAETEKHFKMRYYTYEHALADRVTEERAIVLSQIFKNAYFMGCSYPDSVMEESRKYWPREALQNPIYAPME
jgi:hypothetical protein